LPFANILPVSYFRLDLRQPNIDTPFFPPVFCILSFFSYFSRPFTLPAAAGNGFELALFSPRPKPENITYYLIIKELMPIPLNLKLALFCQIILFSVFCVLPLKYWLCFA
jgi:hypothetical protein